MRTELKFISGVKYHTILTDLNTDIGNYTTCGFSDIGRFKPNDYIPVFNPFICRISIQLVLSKSAIMKY